MSDARRSKRLSKDGASPSKKGSPGSSKKKKKNAAASSAGGASNMAAQVVGGGESKNGGSMLTFDEVTAHNTAGDTWVIINGNAYDLTDFAAEHPGGSSLVTEQAGKDCTAPFEHAHPESIMTLTLGKAGKEATFRGKVDPATIPSTADSGPSFANQEALSAKQVQDVDGVPPLEAVLNLHDFAAIAQRKMVSSGLKQTWDYYSSGADDELTYNENVNAFQRIWLKPRILVDVKELDLTATILGVKTELPIYLSAVAMCGMGHADGEIAWTKAAGEEGIMFMVPNLSSKPFEKIIEPALDEQALMYQIYVNPDRSVVKDQLVACEAAGMKALCITVDSAVPGKRERDLRNKIQLKLKQQSEQAAAAKGTKTRKAGSYANRDAALNWSDIAWFKKNTSIPLVLKGVQTGADAVIAAKHGIAAVILSNHGGRNLDTSRSGIEVLPEVMAALRAEGLDKKMEVWVDGGVRRGTDIVKAMALGASAVGLGKPAVYAMSAYGADGICKMTQVLREELEKCMRLVGAKTWADLTPDMVNIDSIGHHAMPSPIPASPYAIKGPAYGTRDPSFPTPLAQMNAAEIREQISKLEQQLSQVDKAGSARRSSAAAPVEVGAYSPTMLMRLIWVMLVSIGKSVFAATVSQSLHRSALFLLAFLVVHLFGNMAVFFGPEVFNGYGHKLRHNPLLLVVEYYLLAAVVVHAIAAGFGTWRKRKMIAKKPAANGKLMFSAIVVTAFLVTHLLDLRFGSEELKYTQADGSLTRDLYSLQLSLFQNKGRVLWYLVAIAAVGIHLLVGWEKTVPKMDIPKEWRTPFVALGRALVYPLCIGFALCPIFAWAIQQPFAAKYVKEGMFGIKAAAEGKVEL